MIRDSNYSIDSIDSNYSIDCNYREDEVDDWLKAEGWTKLLYAMKMGDEVMPCPLFLCVFLKKC